VDLRVYYSKVREAESSLIAEHTVMVSLATSEGGKPGVRTEVSRQIGARLIAEGRARVATPEEAEEFHEIHREARAKHEQQESARRIQVMVIPQQDLKKHESGAKRDRG
jgi:hypothetical protein